MVKMSDDEHMAEPPLSMLECRSLQDGDVPAVIALWERCGLTRPWNDPATDIAFARGKASSDVLVGLLDGLVVASVMVGHDGHRGAVYYVSVDPARQKQDLGRAIMAAAEGWLRARGVWKLNLLVREENAQAMGFYRSIGHERAPVISMQRQIDRES